MSRFETDIPDEYQIELDEAWLEEELRAGTFRSEAHPTVDRGSPYGEWPNDLVLASWKHPLCNHPPRCVLKSEEGGWNVWAGAGRDCEPSMRKFDLLLNLSGESVLAQHIIPVPELSQWQKPPLLPEILLNWPDMGAVDLPREFWIDLVAHLARARAQLLVFCVGGHGRTGTAIACLMVVCGWQSREAIDWVRNNYCPCAIETIEQERYIRSIAAEDIAHGEAQEKRNRRNGRP